MPIAFGAVLSSSKDDCRAHVSYGRRLRVPSALDAVFGKDRSSPPSMWASHVSASIVQGGAWKARPRSFAFATRGSSSGFAYDRPTAGAVDSLPFGPSMPATPLHRMSGAVPSPVGIGRRRPAHDFRCPRSNMKGNGVLHAYLLRAFQIAPGKKISLAWGRPHTLVRGDQASVNLCRCLLTFDIRRSDPNDC